MQRFIVSSDLVGQRLDRALAYLASTTRSHVRVLIENGCIHVGGVPPKAGYLLRLGDEIYVIPLSVPPAGAVPQSIPLDMLYEDEFLAAINKPPGMVVHPAPGQWEGTVVNALLWRWGRNETSGSLRPGIVHRLDKDTSGVLLVVKDEKTQENLSRQFKERRVQKMYTAVVRGTPSPLQGKIVLPIGRHPVERKKMAVRVRGGREAISQYEVVSEHNLVSLVRLFPETGRTHQLRVHLAAVGHPIIGDPVYGSRGVMRGVPSAIADFPRQALHAERLRFFHPATHEPIMVYAPYPQDFVSLLSTIRSLNEHPPRLKAEKAEVYY
ncbi:MAG: RluA family pseudouridine synthase [Candidatus Binatia bacterium]